MSVADDCQRLVEAGRFDEAARLLESNGQPAAAVVLYERMWDFAAAARAARAAGDLPRALRNTLELRDPTALAALVREATQACLEVMLACAQACEARTAWTAAAQLYRAANEPGRAAACLEQAGQFLEAGQLREGLGDHRSALRLYQLALEGCPSVARVSHACGRLLLRCGRPDEALPLLQRAWLQQPAEEVSLSAGRAVVAALARLGYAAAAGFAFEQLRQQEPTIPARIEALVGDAALAPFANLEGQEKILAGRYRLGALLGSGGMGRVYLATDRLTEQPVAVKVFAAPGGARGRDAFRRFMREACTTGQLQHPHIVSLVDFNEEMGFMVLEYMAGGTLSERLRPALDLPACRAIILQVLEGLAAAHQRGIVHRDIKPSNIFFAASGAAKLGDFGVAQLQDAGQTQSGAFIGTLAFMSPEQIRGGAVTFAADLYALGATLFQMVTGRLPFQPPDIIKQHLTAEPPAPSSLVPALPQLVDEVILRCLAKAPQDRYESLESLQRAVERFPREGSSSEGSLSAQPVRPPAKRRASDRRFTVEASLSTSPTVQVLEARDHELGRTVLLVRLAPGPQREPLLHLLSTAASSGEEHLQRVLALDRERGQAVLETQLGEALHLPLADIAARLSLAEQLGRALAPLHRAELAHGAVAASQIRCLGGDFSLSLTQALFVPRTALPADDIAAVLKLAGASPRQALGSGTELAAWALSEREHLARRSHEERKGALLEEALRRAPPEIRGSRGTERQR